MGCRFESYHASVDKIFVSIVAFDEPFLKETVLSAINNSSIPERVFFGVVEQRSDGNFSDLSTIKNITHKKLKVSEPMGVGLPRSYSMDLSRDEEFCLITDSHMVFNKNWEENLIRRLKYLQRDFGRKVVLSQHLPTAIINDECLVDGNGFNNYAPCYLKFDGMFIDDVPIPDSVEYFEQYAVTCHYLFSFMDTFREVPIDPLHFYFAEESALSMRLVTRGYRIFSTKYFPMLHLQKLPTVGLKSWQLVNGTTRIQDDVVFVYKLFSGSNIGKWGPPSLGALNKFLEVSGLDMSYYLKDIDTGGSEDYIINQIIQKTSGIFDNDKEFYENLYSKFIPEIRSSK